MDIILIFYRILGSLNSVSSAQTKWFFCKSCSTFQFNRILYFFPTLFSQSFGESAEAVKHAIDVGYRHIDTAYLYENEEEVGQAIQQKIKEGVVKREDIFIVTKLWNTDHEPEKVEAECRKSCERLGLGYIDLYLMHYPTAFKSRTPFDFWPKDANGMFEQA